MPDSAEPRASHHWDLPYPSRRAPLLARNVVATSQPLAAQAGLSMLYRGGNAIDAALAAAIALTVVEPTSNGIGSDAFAMVWDGQSLNGLNASGRSPAAWTADRFRGAAMPDVGWESVTVPGAVSAWVALSERFGKLPFEVLFEPAIRYARDGYALSPTVARQWANAVVRLGNEPTWVKTFMPGGRVPHAGELIRFAEHAATLERIAVTRGKAFYEDDLADKMVAHSRANGGAMSRDDLTSHRADWVEPLASPYRDVILHELPPNGQGIAAQLALAILRHVDLSRLPVDSVNSTHLQIEAMKLAFADTYAYVADPAAMPFAPQTLLDPSYAAERAKLIDPMRAQDFGAGTPQGQGTVYLAAADERGMMVSFIQSNYRGFGSGVVVPGTGISLQNRGAGFVTTPGHPNCVGPRKRPFHTIIPGFVTRAGAPLMAFGVMGGPMQAQGHVQMMTRIFDYGQNVQAASDAPRWRVMEGPTSARAIAVEAEFPRDVVEGLMQRGHLVTRSASDDYFDFGSAQLIHRTEHGYVAASDHRRDGQAVGF